MCLKVTLGPVNFGYQESSHKFTNDLSEVHLSITKKPSCPLCRKQKNKEASYDWLKIDLCLQQNDPKI